MNMYENNLEYILEELHRIDLIVSFNLKIMRAEHAEAIDDFRGLYISENEVNSILETLPYESRPNVHSGPELEKIKPLTAEINRKKIESINNGKKLWLHTLSELFHLRPRSN